MSQKIVTADEEICWNDEDEKASGSESETEVTEETADDQQDLLSDYAATETRIELMHSRLDTLAGLGLERFTCLEYLGCRQNLIKDLSPLSSLPTLVEVDFYDNRLKRISESIGQLTRLTSLDLSFNKIRAIENVETLAQLSELFFVSNKIARIENLGALRMLTNLELGANRIRQIEGLGELEALEQLYLGKNKIAKLEGLDKLKRLRVLSIQSNRIVTMEGLDELVALEELYLSHNGIETIQGLECNGRLTILDVTSNRLTKLEGIGHLELLEDLWVSGNQLDSFDNIERVCGPLQALRTAYFEFNPLQRAQPATYRRKVMLALPQLTQIDATPCR
ncbi:protein phosphatase regulatory subunit Sds22 [Coemansia sp. S610]|nr:protein phosphatase regulatory subunit Sds22 [Coemansia sp. RSA 2675]KAJ2011455.1 protein phosphatase regulatory subunit Sds22 [Coemansia sp. S610]KAJ2364217.1 protein phosphatase regulatory subunit Sds22 [Coemansia sp. RSA 2611]KAJ2413607.1 protein phosphatase regulatory subunit Sds22 [Coemansia sp. RSA 2530]KAJ2696126.1 protein phosphatase regulatory subunit Sds22 [Coemansia sp. IMI 209128]